MNGRRLVGLIALVAGAGGSLYCVLLAGQRTPIVLLVLFLGWVALPFAALLLAHRGSEHWSEGARTALCWFSVLFAGGSVLVYRYVLQHPAKKMAFPFLVVPIASWLLLAAAWGMFRGSRSR